MYKVRQVAAAKLRAAGNQVTKLSSMVMQKVPKTSDGKFIYASTTNQGGLIQFCKVVALMLPDYFHLPWYVALPLAAFGKVWAMIGRNKIGRKAK